MPRLNNDLEEHQLPTANNYGYSAASIKALEDVASEFTLVDVVFDQSASVGPFKREMEKVMQQVVQACQRSPRSDNLLLRVLLFNDQLEEFHGYKLLSECNLADYDGCMTPCSMTALFDATENSIQAQAHYAEQLVGADFGVNGIVIIVTDGEDNRSVATKKVVKEALAKVQRSEVLESLLTILVGVGTDSQDGRASDLKGLLEAFVKESGLSQYVDVGEATPNKLAKLAEFVSRSISSQSQSLGSGGPSTLIDPNSLGI